MNEKLSERNPECGNGRGGILELSSYEYTHTHIYIYIYIYIHTHGCKVQEEERTHTGALKGVQGARGREDIL
jgi:hypothetical protein